MTPHLPLKALQAFDAVNIICMGALRGAGDTRWMMWMTAFMSYGFCLPLSIFFAFGLGLETYGAWMGATAFIMVLSGVLFRRFHSERPDGEAFGRHSGLGLAIARTIIEGHGGTISARDRDDGKPGASLLITLPAREGSGEAG